MPLLTGVFLSYLKFKHDICVLKPAEEGVNRLSYLEIDGTVFDLQYNVVVEFSVKTDKVNVALGGAVGCVVPPVLLAVVNKAPPDDDGAIFLHNIAR